MISLLRRRLVVTLSSGLGCTNVPWAWGAPVAPVIRSDRASFFALARTGPALIAAGERGVIARSTDEGQSWQVMRTASARNFTTALGHSDGLSIVAGHGGVMFRSVDAGASCQVRLRGIGVPAAAHPRMISSASSRLAR